MPPTPAQMAATHAAAFRQDRPWSADEFAGLLQNSGCLAVGDAQCFALVRVVVDEAELLTIATHPDHRRQGRARAVMRDWMARAADMGARRAFLEVAADNLPAIALYESVGFAGAGVRRAYYRRAGTDPADALLMTCDLPLGHPGDSPARASESG